MLLSRCCCCGDRGGQLREVKTRGLWQNYEFCSAQDGIASSRLREILQLSSRAIIREFKIPQQRQQRKRHLKSDFTFFETSV